MRHVVAVADVGERQAGEAALLLADRHQVRERLAGMRQVGERVDHRDAGSRREGVDAVLAEGAQHDRGHVPRQDLGGVLNGFPAAELSRAGVDVDRVTAELGDRDVEGQPGAGRWLLEHERDGLRPGQRLVGERVLLAPVRVVEDCLELCRGEVVIHQEVLPRYGSLAGKGEALWKSLHVLTGDLVAWIDTRRPPRPTPPPRHPATTEADPTTGPARRARPAR